MSFQPAPINQRQAPVFLEMRTVALVERCRRLICNRVEACLATRSEADLAQQLWQGDILVSELDSVLFPAAELRQLLAGLEAEVGSRIAGLFRRPVNISLHLPAGRQGSAAILAEELAAGKDTYLLACLLKKASHKVCKQALAGCPALLQELKPEKALTRYLGLQPAVEKDFWLQELAQMIAGRKAAWRHYLVQELTLQAAVQVWSLYDACTTRSALVPAAVTPVNDNIA